MSLLPVFRKKNSGEIARNRLKLLLVADKADCSPEKLKQPDCERFIPVLYANIPIRDAPDKGIY